MERIRNIISKLFFIICISISEDVFLQYSHFFENYSISDYHAANQNWGLSKSSEGKLYVANNIGLLEFDGIKWNLHKLPAKTIIRSVLVHNDKIFVGTYEDFGYFYKNNKGALIYVSILDLQKEGIKSQKNEEFWQIVVYNDNIIFRSFLNVYFYNKGKLKIYNADNSILMSCDVVNNDLYVSTLEKGIFKFHDNEFQLFLKHKKLEHTNIVSIISINPKKLLINTSLKGSFLYESGRLSQWGSNTKIDYFIRKNKLNKAVRLSNGNFVFGTIKNGVYITDEQGAILYQLNTALGLQNNTISAIYETSNNELWLGLDNGISVLDLESPYIYYNDYSGRLGAVYDVINFKETIYVGTNTGLYKIKGDGTLEFIEGSQGHIWDLKEIQGELLCGHNEGTYAVRNNKLKLVSPHTGGLFVMKIPSKNNLYIQGTYGGLIRLSKNKNEWTAEHLSIVTSPIKYLVFEDDYTAWGANITKGLYRLKFDKDHKKILSVTEYNDRGLWSDYLVRLYKIRNTIIMHTPSGWQRYEPLTDSIVPLNFKNKHFTKESYIISEYDLEPKAFKINNTILIGPVFGDTKLQVFENRLIIGNENISKINDSILALNLYNGFMLIDISEKNKSIILSKPVVNTIAVNGELVVLNNRLKVDKKDEIELDVFSPNTKNPIFEYHITSLNKFFKPQFSIEKNTSGKIKLKNLEYGTYSVSIKTTNGYTLTSEANNIVIIIVRPWHKSIYAYIVYTLCLFLIYYLIRYIFRINDKKRSEIIVEKEKLKKDLKTKTKELADNLILIVKKNETLERIRNLIMLKNKKKSQLYYPNILKQIELSLKNSNQKMIFNQNFELIHEELFNKLKNFSSKLNAKDLQLCAYLKMDFSTKKIAANLNISIRGVETKIYRLKRKLNLDKGKTLRSFVKDLK